MLAKIVACGIHSRFFLSLCHLCIGNNPMNFLPNNHRACHGDEVGTKNGFFLFHFLDFWPRRHFFLSASSLFLAGHALSSIILRVTRNVLLFILHFLFSNGKWKDTFPREKSHKKCLGRKWWPFHCWHCKKIPKARQNPPKVTKGRDEGEPTWKRQVWANLILPLLCGTSCSRSLWNAAPLKHWIGTFKTPRSSSSFFGLSVSSQRKIRIHCLKRHSSFPHLLRNSSEQIALMK